MHERYAYSTQGLISDARALWAQSRLARDVLVSGAATTERVTSLIEEAGTAYLDRGRDFHTFQFQRWRMEGSPDHRRQAAGDLYLGAATDLQAGASLAAAEQDLKDFASAGALPRFTQALDDLKRLTAPPQPQPGGESVDVMRILDQTLTILVDETRNALFTIGDKATKPLHELLSRLGEVTVDLIEASALGKLAALGAKLIRRALETLKALFGGDGTERIKELLSDLWKTEPQRWAEQGLSSLFTVEESRQLALARAAFWSEDEAQSRCQELVLLGDTYRGKMHLAAHLTDALALATALPVLGLATHLGLVLGAYGLICAAVLLIGMDYSDDGTSLGWVRGIRGVLTCG